MDDYHSLNGGSLLHLVAVECSLEQVDRTSCLRVLLKTSLKHKVDHGDNSGP